jgi:hypothetical protein
LEIAGLACIMPVAKRLEAKSIGAIAGYKTIILAKVKD